MTKTVILVAIPALFLMAAGASGQQTFTRNGGAPEGYVTIQSSVSMSLPADQSIPLGDQIESGQKTLYEVVSKSCSLVLDILADDCKIAGITSNVDMQRMSRDPVVAVRGQVTLWVKLKSPPAGK